VASIANASHLGKASLLQLDAQVDILEHDGLQYLLPRPMALAGDNIVQSLQRRMGLANSDQLIGPLERVLRLGERRAAPLVARHGGRSTDSFAAIFRGRCRHLCPRGSVMNQGKRES
jgi:hypothetical protein